jgi:hypothetical protein
MKKLCTFGNLDKPVRSVEAHCSIETGKGGEEDLSILLVAAKNALLRPSFAFQARGRAFMLVASGAARDTCHRKRRLRE